MHCIAVSVFEVTLETSRLVQSWVELLFVALIPYQCSDTQDSEAKSNLLSVDSTLWNSNTTWLVTYDQHQLELDTPNIASLVKNMVPTHFPQVLTRSTGQILGRIYAQIRSRRFLRRPKAIRRQETRPSKVTRVMAHGLVRPHSRSCSMVSESSLGVTGLFISLRLDCSQSKRGYNVYSVHPFWQQNLPNIGILWETKR